MSTTIPDDVDDDEVEEARDYLEENLCDSGLIEKCETSVKGNKLQFEGTVTDDGLEEENYTGSKEEIQESLEDDGYSCE